MRKKAYVITDDNYYSFLPDIGSDVVWKVLMGLREVYKADYFIVPEPNYLAYNLLSISMFFDTKRNRLYLTYKLDDNRTIALRVSDSELYNRIYDSVYMITVEQDIKLSIIGTPTRYPEDSLNRSYGRVRQNDQHLRIDTQSIWTNIPGPRNIPYDWFIENKDYLDDDIIKNRVSPEDVSEFCQKVVQLNKEYVYIEHPDYYEAFDKYKDIYMEYFNRELTPIEDWRAFTIYVDVKHKYDNERMDTQEHDLGKVYNFERVKEYIKQWGRDHGKDVPDGDDE